MNRRRFCPLHSLLLAACWIVGTSIPAPAHAEASPSRPANDPAIQFDPAVLHTRLVGTPLDAGEFQVIVGLRNNSQRVVTYALSMRWSLGIQFVDVRDAGGGLGSRPTSLGTGQQRTFSALEAASTLVEGDLFVLTLSSPGAGTYSIAIDGFGPTPLVARGPEGFVRMPFTTDASLTTDIGGPAALPAKSPPTEYPGDVDLDGIPSPPEMRFPRGDTTGSLLDDSDGDGLTDDTEDANRNGRWDNGETGARHADSDRDGIEDGVEVRVLASDPLDPGDPGAYVDADGDGLPADVDPNDGAPDTDGDDIQDAYEAAILDVTAAADASRRPPLGDVNNDGFYQLLAPGDASAHVQAPEILTLDTLMIHSLFVGVIAPNHVLFGDAWFRRGDVNRDGAITNADAAATQSLYMGFIPYHPQPLLAAADDDRDGLANVLEELVPPPGLTNTWLPDSDGDGLPDGDEDADQDALREPEETDPRARDSDGDGLIDGIETKILHTDPTDAGDPAVIPADADNDGYPAPHDLFEANPDADGDRYKDGYEAAVFGRYEAPLTVLIQPRLGDANGDGSVSNLDALATMTAFLRLVDPGSIGGIGNADVNLDGLVTNLDALGIQAFFLRLVPRLPIGTYGVR